MTIYRSSGKNTEICEEYVLYTRNYVENVGGKSTITAKGGTTFGDKPETAKPLEITNLYVKVRLKDNYNGEFGFDWVDVDPETKQIEKIQGVPFSEVEYFYKKDPANPDLGDIVATSTDPIGAKHAIQDHYNFNPVSKHIDIPYALIKLGKTIKLSAEIIVWKHKIKNDILTITGDEFYEFVIENGEKEGNTAKIKLTKAGKINFSIKCLKEGGEKKYDFNHISPITGSHAVGGITMMENKELVLKFRVIALVSSDGNPTEKAKTLFKKFKDNEITDYLNNNSLNQAGYKVEIENETMFKSLDDTNLDDYFYAFDKEDWTKRNLFSVDENRKKYTLVKDKKGEEKFNIEQQEGQLLLNYEEQDGIDSNGNKKYKTYSNDLDYITIASYQNKLKTKYVGGTIILSDLECSNAGVAAFSRMFPINHYGLFVSANGIESKSTYAHELGHMLGLEHTFFEEDEKKESKDKINKIKSYKNKIEECNEKIIKEKTSNQISETNLNAKPLKNQSKVLNTFKKFFIKKQTLEECLINTNSYLVEKIGYTNEQIKFYTDKVNDKKEYSSYSIAEKKVSKAEFNETLNNNLKINQTEKTVLDKELENNQLTLNRLCLINIDNLFEFDSEYHLTYEDMLKIYNDYLELKLEKEWQVITANYLYFNYKSTENIMDYGQILSGGKDSAKKNKFLSHQIIIMRNDYENYK
nr:M43 family zinc metalloprotease [uncultured Flavobacterium sp.]